DPPWPTVAACEALGLAHAPAPALAPDRPPSILLTGATGTLGAHLLRALHARVPILALVRAPDDAAAHRRLAALDLALPGVTAVAGDLSTLADLRLPSSPSTVLHTAARTDLAPDWDALAP